MVYIVCPFCQGSELKVIDSRASEDKKSIRRRRECESCGKRFTTYEKIEDVPLMVVKKNNLREEYDRNKLLNGITKACWKRPISITDIELLVSDVENTIAELGKAEIDTSLIGSIVMNKLKEIDEIAYVRFASVYKEFKDVDSFLDELKMLG